MANVIEFSIKGTDDFSGVIGKAEGALSGLKNAIVAVAAAYPVAKIAGMIKDSIDMAEAAGQAAQKVGMSTQEFSAMALAAQIANVEQSSLMMGMKQLSTAMVDAGSAGSKALNAIGVASRDASGSLRPVNSVLLDLADKFSKTRDDAAKAKTAVDLFGKAGLSMVPFLNQGSEAIEEMMKTAEALGLTFTDETAAAADQVNDNLELISMTGQGLVNRVTAQMLPTFESLSNSFLNFASNQELVRSLAAALSIGLKTVVTIGVAVAEVFNVGGKIIAAFMATLIKFLHGDYQEAANILKASSEDIVQSVSNSVNQIGDIWGDNVESAAASAAKLAIATRKSAESMAVHTEKDDEALKKKKDLQKAIDDMERSLRSQIVMFGQNSDAVKIYELRLKGATDQQLEELKVLNAILEAKEKKKQADEEAKSLLDQSATPYDRLIQQLTKVNELQEMSALNEEQASELRQRAMEEWQQSSEAIEWHKTVVTDYLEETSRMLMEKLSGIGTWQFQVAQMLTDTAMNMSQSIGQSMAAVIMQGQNFSQALMNIMKNVAQQIIASLIQIGVQRLMLSVIGATAARTQAAAEMSKSLAGVYLNSFASAAAIPMVGWMIAPGAAASNLALATAGGAAAMAAGMGMGGAAHGGLDFVPEETTFLLQRGERVLSPRQNADLTSFMENGGAGGGSVSIQTVEIHILENATSGDVFARMNRVELREALGQPVVDALNEMFRIGVRPDFAMGQT